MSEDMGHQPGSERRGSRHKEQDGDAELRENHTVAAEELERMLGTGQLVREQLLTQMVDPSTSTEAKMHYEELSSQMAAVEDIVLMPYGVRDGQLLQRREIPHNGKTLTEIRRFVPSRFGDQRTVVAISYTADLGDTDLVSLMNAVRIADVSEGRVVDNQTVQEVGNAALRYNDFLQKQAEKNPGQLEAELANNANAPGQ